jgi:hypothetical protein
MEPGPGLTPLQRLVAACGSGASCAMSIMEPSGPPRHRGWRRSPGGREKSPWHGAWEPGHTRWDSECRERSRRARPTCEELELSGSRPRRVHLRAVALPWQCGRGALATGQGRGSGCLVGILVYIGRFPQLSNILGSDFDSNLNVTVDSDADALAISHRVGSRCSPCSPRRRATGSCRQPEDHSSWTRTRRTS